MGRGRAKAKQTKVARELKYNTPATDFDRLQEELSGGSSSTRVHSDEDDDPYASWSDGDGRH